MTEKKGFVSPLNIKDDGMEGVGCLSTSLLLKSSNLANSQQGIKYTKFAGILGIQFANKVQVNRFSMNCFQNLLFRLFNDYTIHSLYNIHSLQRYFWNTPMHFV